MDSKHNFESVALGSNKPSRPTIGLFKNSDMGYVYKLQWEGLVEAVKKYDVNLICYSGGQIACDDPAASIYELVTTDRLDGLLIWTGNITWHAKPGDIERFVKSYLPIPVICIEVPVAGVTSLLWDDGEIREVIEHLIEVHHCKRIAFVRGKQGHIAIEQRYQMYLQVLAEHGISYDPELIFSENWLYEEQEGMKKIYDRITAGRFDALVGASDWLVRQIINIMEVKGLPLVPCVGFDDIIEGRARRPTLTTIRPPFAEIGYRAVERMVEMLAGHTVMEFQRLPCSMIVRRSCGCGSVVFQREERWEACLSNYSNSRDTQAGIGPEAFEKLVDGLANVPQINLSDWKVKLFKVFLEEAQGGEKNLFAAYFETLLAKTEETDGDVDSWNDILLVLYTLTKPIIKGWGTDTVLPEKLVRQGIMLVAEAAVRSEMSQKLLSGSKQYHIMNFIHELGRSIDLKGILDQIYRGLVQLGILGFCLLMYDKPGNSTDQARLILACDENGTRLAQFEGMVFPARQLVPDGILPLNHRFSYIVKPLLFLRRKLGFMLFRANERYELSDYEMLSNSISITLNSVLLIKDLENQALELSKANRNFEAAYQSLQENQQKLLISEQMASLGRLTAGIAHELNTPLATIQASLTELEELVSEYRQSIGNPQVLPEDYLSIAADMAKQLKLAKQATVKNADFLRGIKAQIVDLKFVNLQWFNAALVIRDTVNFLGFELKKGLCKLVTVLDDSVRLYGDPRRLVQVITNLVMNGIDACKPDGGVITVTLANSGDGFAEILVQDTGCGIAEEIKSKIFDPMFTTKPFGEGTGLGLSIVHELIDEYKGTISVNSQKGLTTFKIRLPLNKEE